MNAVMRRRLVAWLIAPALLMGLGLGVSGCASGRAAAFEAPAAHRAVMVGEGATLPVAEAIEPDAEMVAMLVPYEQGVAPMRERVATNAQLLERGRGGGAAGAWLADVMLDRARVKTGNPVVLSVANAGGVRDSLPAGDVSREKIHAVMPFDNSLVVYDLDAEEFQRLLDFLADRAPYFPVGGGVVQRMAVHQPAVLLVDGAPYEPGPSNLVTTNSYLAGGGDDARLFVEFGEHEDLKDFLRDLMVEWAQELDARGDVITMPANVPRYNVVE